MVRSAMRGPASSLFVSYDGALDPLGRSQVLPYVVGLARQGVSMSLITFEKPSTDRAEMERLSQTLAGEGVRSTPLAYHRRPRLPATALDVAQGAAAVAREVRRARPEIVHCRGDVAMAMARAATPRGRPSLLY